MAVNLTERKTEIHKITVTFEVDLHGTEIELREARNVLDYISDDDNADEDQLIADSLSGIIFGHIDGRQHRVCIISSVSGIAHEVL